MLSVSTTSMIPVRRVFLSLLVLAGPTMAQGKNTPAPQEEQIAPPIVNVPYDDKLARFAEVLGSVHYLRTLCKAPGGDEWRNSMQQLLDSETGNEQLRKEKLTAAFNRGYRAFASVYTDCTPAAIVAEERYRNEGATLATEITSRFGN
ncbi:TIGR02301 family protein [Rhizobium leguminosarum]|uniref:TIGR02301 family protein n=1 Tax=Rhizobium leguminosarum TaxID=384 RepID=UPI00035CCA06|nr:TIGR02301 family protein [Rhizobium leguminosarum]MBY2922650.1 TIGR02301 family protein [Rhizobium leguminosarum]MBY2961169.1 TIGR02301 family protein [Rhizobium leguminosarum]MBY2992064.1 TIGR02301 family protein [Rhizobium leguminosarum]MBY3027836.1 TIGR02301 family protein [Rhizobium leguminosarum]MBY3057628.1 TIGR02301 family protein [Rhizobium leguminosarum]